MLYTLPSLRDYLVVSKITKKFPFKLRIRRLTLTRYLLITRHVLISHLTFRERFISCYLLEVYISKKIIHVTYRNL